MRLIKSTGSVVPLGSFFLVVACLLPAFSQNAETLNEQGIEQAIQGNLKEAIELFNQAIAVDNSLAKAYNNRANAKKDLEDIEGSLSDYNQAIALDSHYCDAYRNRGLLHETKRGNLSGALADYDASITCNPKDAVAYYRKAYILGFELGVSTRQAAVFGFTQARDLFQERGDSESAQLAEKNRLIVCENHKNYGYTLSGCN